MSYSAFFSLSQKIDNTIRSIVEFYLPKGGTIYDPTCGEQNRQFRSWVNLFRFDGVKYKYIKSDIEPYGDFQCDFRKERIPLEDGAANVTVYDPPFTPYGKMDPRKKDYNVQIQRSVDELKAYFSEQVYKEFARVTTDFIIVRGQDFYYPPNSCDFYPFYSLALSTIEGAGLKLRALHPFRYNHSRMPLYRARLKDVVRPLITHGYIAVLAKPEAPVKRNGAEIRDIVMTQYYDTGNEEEDFEQKHIL